MGTCALEQCANTKAWSALDQYWKMETTKTPNDEVTLEISQNEKTVKSHLAAVRDKILRLPDTEENMTILAELEMEKDRLEVPTNISKFVRNCSKSTPMQPIRSTS